MYVKNIFSIVMYIVLSIPLFADPVLLLIDGGGGRNLGLSTYDFNYRDTDTGIAVSSRLEFPLDYFFANVKLGIEINKGKKRDISASLEMITNITEPASVMKDHDWLKIPYYQPLKISYTESTVKARTIIAEARFKKYISRLWIFDFFISTGYTFIFISQDIYGYEGWQMDFETGEGIDIQGDDHALYYEVSYHVPIIGGLLSWKPASDILIDLETHGLVTYAFDRDDHILRNKLSTADGLGYGFSTSISFSWFFMGQKKGLYPFLILQTQFMMLFVPAKQKQRWYGDDPGTPENETGMVISNLNHDLTCMQLNGIIKAGMIYRF